MLLRKCKGSRAVFDHVTAQQARKALKGMQLCHKALYAPGKTKRNLLFGA